MAQIKATLTQDLEVSISNGRHEWLADEPPRAGGEDAGPDPYELLLSSLAACTCITIAGYCRHKEMDLKSVTATYEFGRVHADDCVKCDESETGFIEQIVSNVHIEGDFDDKQRKRLAQIATQCPVHKTLAKGVDIVDNASFA